MATLGAPLIEDADGSPGVEIFGALRLQLKPKSKSRYASVYEVKKGWQAKVWDKARQTLINLGTFETPRDADVAVAETRLTGIASVPSPDKSRMKRGSGGRALPSPRRVSARPSVHLVQD